MRLWAHVCACVIVFVLFLNVNLLFCHESCQYWARVSLPELQERQCVCSVRLCRPFTLWYSLDHRFKLVSGTVSDDTQHAISATLIYSVGTGGASYFPLRETWPAVQDPSPSNSNFYGLCYPVCPWGCLNSFKVDMKNEHKINML